MSKKLEIHKLNNIGGFPALEIKYGNTVYTVTGEYSKTTAVTLKQRLEQIIIDKAAGINLVDKPLECMPDPSESCNDA